MKKLKFITVLCFVLLILFNSQLRSQCPAPVVCGSGTNGDLVSIKLNGLGGIKTFATFNYGTGITLNTFGGDILLNSSTNVAFRTNNSERLFITSNGNIGIGTNQPGSKLTVIGDVSFATGGISQVNIGSAFRESTGYGTGYIGMNLKSLNNQWTMVSDGANNGGAMIYSNVNGKIRFVSIASTGNSNRTLTDLDILNSTRMIIENNGNVYIKGKLTVEEIEVKVPAWSDFVFKTDYKLASLQEVENYIKQNGHLSGIPSEKEAIENGVKLSEMNTLLLQKIEELTLYVIEQDKNIKKLQSKITQLENTDN